MKLDEFDVVRVTGVAGNGIRYSDCLGTIATVSKDGSIKLWPSETDDSHDGKLWFDFTKLESVVLVEKDVIS